MHNYTKAARHAVSEFFYQRHTRVEIQSIQCTSVAALRPAPQLSCRDGDFFLWVDLAHRLLCTACLRTCTAHAQGYYACALLRCGALRLPDGTVVGGDVGIGCRRIRTAEEVLKCECLVAPAVGYALRFLATSIAAQTLRIVQAIIHYAPVVRPTCSAYVVGHGIGLFSCVSFHYLDQHAAKNAPAFVVDSSTLTFCTALASV